MNWMDLTGLAVSVATLVLAVLLAMRMRRIGASGWTLLCETVVALVSVVLTLSDLAAIVVYGIDLTGDPTRGVPGLVGRLLVLAATLLGTAMARTADTGTGAGDGSGEDDGKRH